MIDAELHDSQQTPLANLLRQLQDLPQQWFSAAKALGMLGSAALPMLLQLNANADDILRQKIVYALGDILAFHHDFDLLWNKTTMGYYPKRVSLICCDSWCDVD